MDVQVFHTEEGGTGHKNPIENGPGMPPNEDPPSWSTGLSMQKVNDVANMWGCTMPSEHSGPTPSTCPVNASLDGTLANPGAEPEFCDKVIANDAVAKLRLLAANYAKTAQPFFMACGFRKPCVACYVTVDMDARLGAFARCLYRDLVNLHLRQMLQPRRA